MTQRDTAAKKGGTAHGASKGARILVVEDDAAHRAMLKTILGSWGHAVLTVEDGDEAVAMVRDQAFDVVLSDVRMARVDGIHALEEILNYNPALPVVLMTAYSSVDTAVKALRLGAADYLVKPLDFDALKETLKRVMAQAGVGIGDSGLRRRLGEALSSEDGEAGGMLGRSPAMCSVLDTIRTVAPTEATVLITGESGTGKELAARALHGQSGRARKSMVTVNCAALAESLLESELFGHEKGAFTGADKRRDGRFVQADGGTLFLDEIGEMPLPLQAKLLRALQQGEVQRVGSDVPVTVDVRVIAATNRDLARESSEGRFRQDLFFRLNVINIEMPPLRARPEDIPLLAMRFLGRFAEKNRKAVRGFTPRAMDALIRYPWPGNVRELENAVERAVILAAGEMIDLAQLPAAVEASSVPPDDETKPAEDKAGALGLNGLTLDRVERLAIEETLRETEGNKSAAARRLGITRATLHSKLKKYDIE
ncbi:MAG: sigma-54 dependent transcriptional regulator [Desulfovibrio sp.]|nr:sigma-54 dependent transcriptional regulator [Desulfovibrio sp.]